MDEGVRSCVNLKLKKKVGYCKSWLGSILEKVVKVSKMDIENYCYYVELESVEGYLIVFGFDLMKVVKN